MKTRTEHDITLFNEAIDKCTRPVWLVSSDGASFDLKSFNGHNAGLAKWISDTNDETEIFTSSYEDEAVMMGFWQRLHAA